MPHGSWARRYAAPLRGRPLLRVAQRKDEDFVPLSNNTTQKRSVNFKRGLDIWHVDNVIQMMPFYVFGLVLVPVIIRNYRLWLATAFLGLKALICVTYFCGNIATNGMSFYWDKIDVFCLDVHKIINYFLRIVVGTLGCLFILLVLRKLTQLSWVKKIAFVGTETLGMYFLQGWLIRIFVLPWIGLDACVLILLLASSCVFLLAFTMVKILKVNKNICGLVFGKK